MKRCKRSLAMFWCERINLHSKDPSILAGCSCSLEQAVLIPNFVISTDGLEVNVVSGILQVGNEGTKRTLYYSGIYNTLLWCYSTVLHYSAGTVHCSSLFIMKWLLYVSPSLRTLSKNATEIVLQYLLLIKTSCAVVSADIL